MISAVEVEEVVVRDAWFRNDYAKIQNETKNLMGGFMFHEKAK